MGSDILPTQKSRILHAQIVMLLVGIKYNYDMALCNWIKGVSSVHVINVFMVLISLFVPNCTQI